MPKITKNCATCGKEFRVYPSEFQRRRFCSRPCYSPYQTSSKPRIHASLQWLLEAIATETDDCILWPFMKDKKGYGRIGLNGKSRKVTRIVLFITDPEFEESMNALHHCDNPPCFNPRHLFKGTTQDNIDDKIAKGRMKIGEQHGRSKLTADSVREIRKRFIAGEGKTAIARSLGVGFTAIHDLLRGKNWKHIT